MPASETSQTANLASSTVRLRSQVPNVDAGNVYVAGGGLGFVTTLTHGVFSF